MKDLKTLCDTNIPNSLHSLLEASILDIDGTFEEGDKLENLNLTSIFNSKTRLEFEAKFDIFRSMFENYTEVYDIKPRKTYIVFVENTSMTRKNDICNLVIYIGTNKDFYRLTWTIFGTKSKMELRKIESFNIEFFTEKTKYLNTSIYVCPKKIKDEANKLIIHNLE